MTEHDNSTAENDDSTTKHDNSKTENDDSTTDPAPGTPDYLTEDPPVDQAFRCESCAHRWYYTRGSCPECRSDDLSTVELGVGEVIGTTTVAVTPPDVREPNRLALAQFGDIQLIAQLTAEVAVGDQVEFSGEYELRDGGEKRAPRLTPIE